MIARPNFTGAGPAEGLNVQCSFDGWALVAYHPSNFIPLSQNTMLVLVFY